MNITIWVTNEVVPRVVEEIVCIEESLKKDHPRITVTSHHEGAYEWAFNNSVIATVHLVASERLIVHRSEDGTSDVAVKAAVTTYDHRVCEIETYSGLTELCGTLARKLRDACNLEQTVQEAQEAIKALEYHIFDEEDELKL